MEILSVVKLAHILQTHTGASHANCMGTAVHVIRGKLRSTAMTMTILQTITTNGYKCLNCEGPDQAYGRACGRFKQAIHLNLTESILYL